MKKKLIVLFLMCIYHSSEAQLIHISNADKTSFYDSLNVKQYPALGVYESYHKNKGPILWFTDSLKFDYKFYRYNVNDKDPEHLLYEVYNSKYFVISVLNYSERSKGDPAVMLRNNVYFVDLEKRDAIYKASFDNIYLVPSETDLELFSFEEPNFYAIRKIDLVKLKVILLKVDGKVHELKLTKINY